MTMLQEPDIELILDVRDLRTPPGDRDEFAALWNLLEPALNGRDLSARRVHEMVGTDRTLRVEVTRIADGTGLVTAGTRFAVVAVLEVTVQAALPVRKSALTEATRSTGPSCVPTGQEARNTGSATGTSVSSTGR